MQNYPIYLAGQRLTPNQDLIIRDKYSLDVFATAPLATSAHIDRAIQAAWQARGPMQRLTAAHRKKILQRCADQITASKEDFVQILVREAGKPVLAARLEVDRCVETFSIAAEEASRLSGKYLALDGSLRGGGYSAISKRFPVGVCSLITPFNFPLNLVAHKVAPAIAAGCPFVLKPASWTPVCSLMLGDILAECDMPTGSFSIVPTTRQSASPLITDDRIAMVSFTGSDKVGWQIKHDCGKKRVCLELGGNAACIIDQGFSWQKIVTKIVTGAYAQSGQSCISLQRLMIHRDDYESAIAELQTKIAAIKSGDPFLEETLVGPMIDSNEADRILNWIAQAKRNGATELVQAKRIEGTTVVTPSLLVDVPQNHALCCEEAFGPVLIVEAYERFDEALDRINQSKYGLQAGLFTNNIRNAWRAWETLEVGGLVVGDTPNTRFDAMPYGGVKASGMGKEGVAYAMEEMTYERLMLLNQNE